MNLDKKKTHNADRNILVMDIAQELLDKEILDENNFSYDTETLLQCTCGIILEHLKDYILISGRLI